MKRPRLQIDDDDESVYGEPAPTWFFILILALLVIVAYVLIASIPAARTAMMETAEEEISSENRAACEALAITARTVEHERCIAVLMDIRGKHEQRIAAESQGIF